MGKGWFDFRSGSQRERDLREFSQRVFPGGLEHRRQVRRRLQEVMGKTDITYEFLYYVALKDLLVRMPSVDFEEGMNQVCGEIRVMKLDDRVRQGIRKVMTEDLDGKFQK